jgi:hypothetical protein
VKNNHDRLLPVLYVHVLALLLLISALSFEALILVRLRQSTTVREARLCIDLVPALPLMAIASLLILFFSGGYLAAKMAAWSLAWPKVAIVAMVLLAPLGAATGRRMQTIRRLLVDEKDQGSTWLAKVNNPFLRLSLSIRFWLVGGIVLLMAAKPGFAQSAAIVAASVLLGVLFVLVSSRREQRLPSLPQ